MFPQRPDSWTIIGTAVSSGLSIYAWLYSIGLVPLFTFVAGSFFTLWTQQRLEKKRQDRDFQKEMTEHFYGPVHQELNLLHEDLEAMRSLTGFTDRTVTLGLLLKDYRYSLVGEELRHRIEDLHERLEPYDALLHEAKNNTEVILDRELQKQGVGDLRFIFTTGLRMETYTLKDAIFSDKTAMDFLSEKMKGYKLFSLQVVAKGCQSSFSREHPIQKLSEDILSKTHENPTVQEQRRERTELLEKCSSIMEYVRKEIAL